MGRKDHRFLVLIVLCSLVGVLLGGTAGWAESNQCFQAELPTSECLSQGPAAKTFEGMRYGLIAGVGSAIGAAWNIKRED